MQIWNCAGCDHTLYFDNVACLRCNVMLGFLPGRLELAAMQTAECDLWHCVGDPDGSHYRRCANGLVHDACNWMVAADDDDPLCHACRLNRIIPDLSAGNNLVLWKRLEGQKRRLVYGLLRLGLPLLSKADDPEHGLAFDFLAEAEPEFREGPGVVTGHADGLITLNVAEADHAVRERLRQQMSEPYRTILGHFRHESGHYYWDRLVRDSNWLDPVRECFGDDQLDYGSALDQHYDNGPPPDWSDHFVSKYASSHPWEDWAESWAHLLHIVDTLETAWQFGMRVRPQVEGGESVSFRGASDPYREADFDALISAWLPLTQALNNLNRSMGQPDLYPFVLGSEPVAKMRLVHQIVQAQRED